MLSNVILKFIIHMYYTHFEYKRIFLAFCCIKLSKIHNSQFYFRNTIILRTGGYITVFRNTLLAIKRHVYESIWMVIYYCPLFYRLPSKSPNVTYKWGARDNGNWVRNDLPACRQCPSQVYIGCTSRFNNKCFVIMLKILK